MEYYLSEEDTDWLKFASVVQRAHRLANDDSVAMVNYDVWAMHNFIYDNHPASMVGNINHY